MWRAPAPQTGRRRLHCGSETSSSSESNNSKQFKACFSEDINEGSFSKENLLLCLWLMWNDQRRETNREGSSRFVVSRRVPPAGEFYLSLQTSIGRESKTTASPCIYFLVQTRTEKEETTTTEALRDSTVVSSADNKREALAKPQRLLTPLFSSMGPGLSRERRQ